MVGRPLLMVVPMDQDLGQIPGAVGFMAVVMSVPMEERSRPGELRRHRGGEEQNSDSERLPCTHAGIVAHLGRGVKRSCGLGGICRRVVPAT